MKFGFDTGFFESLFQESSVVEDTYYDYEIPNVGTFTFKAFDTKFFYDGVTYFRPFIRGFLVLLMVLYHIKQLVGFFGFNSGYVSGRGDYIHSEMKKQKE